MITMKKTYLLIMFVIVLLDSFWLVKIYLVEKNGTDYLQIDFIRSIPIHPTHLLVPVLYTFQGKTMLNLDPAMMGICLLVLIEIEK